MLAHSLVSAEAGLETRSVHLLFNRRDISLIKITTAYLSTGLSTLIGVTSFKLLKHLFDALHS